MAARIRRRQSSPASTEEYSFLVDNIKAILIFLVVFNHYIAFQIVKSDEIVRHVWYAITIFHMPAFVFVSGYLSKHPQNQLKIVKSLLIPYILGYILTWYVQNWAGTSLDFEILRPSGTVMWYLLALTFYRLTIEALGKMRFIILLSIIFALIAGLLPEFSTYLSVSRIVVFFPFFVAGYLWKSSFTDAMRRSMVKIILLLLGGALLYFVPHYMIENRFPIDLFRGNHSYLMSNVTDEAGLLLRGLMYLTSFIVIMVLFSLVPRGRLSVFVGRNTMSVYFLHYPILVVCNGLHFLRLPVLMTWWGAALVSFLLVILLASPPVNWLYNKIMWLVCFILFKNDETEETVSSRPAPPNEDKAREEPMEYSFPDQDVAGDDAVGFDIYGDTDQESGKQGYTMPEDFDEYDEYTRDAGTYDERSYVPDRIGASYRKPDGNAAPSYAGGTYQQPYGNASPSFAGVSYQQSYGNAASSFAGKSYQPSYGNAASSQAGEPYRQPYGNTAPSYAGKSYQQFYGNGYSPYTGEPYPQSYGNGYPSYEPKPYQQSYGNGSPSYAGEPYPQAYGNTNTSYAGEPFRQTYYEPAASSRQAGYEVDEALPPNMKDVSRQDYSEIFEETQAEGFPNKELTAYEAIELYGEALVQDAVSFDDTGLTEE